MLYPSSLYKGMIVCSAVVSWEILNLLPTDQMYFAYLVLWLKMKTKPCLPNSHNFGCWTQFFFIWISECWAVCSLHLHPYCEHRSHLSHSFMIYIFLLCSLDLTVHLAVLAGNFRWSKWSLCNSTTKGRNNSAHRGEINSSWRNSIRGIPWAWIKRTDCKGIYSFCGTHATQFIAAV